MRQKRGKVVNTGMLCAPTRRSGDRGDLHLLVNKELERRIMLCEVNNIAVCME